MCLSESKKRYCRYHQVRLNQRGGALLYLVAVILIAGTLGAGIVYMTSTSTLTELAYNPSDQARYLAEAGLDHAPVFFIYGLDVCANKGNLENYENEEYVFRDDGGNTVFIISGVTKNLSGTKISFDVRTHISSDDYHLMAAYERRGTVLISCSAMSEYFFAAMDESEIQSFIDGEGEFDGVVTSDPEAWEPVVDPRYEAEVTDGVVLGNDPSSGSEQLVFVPMDLEEDCKDYIIRSVAWIDLENRPASGGYGYGILFDTTLDLDERVYLSDTGYSFQFDPGLNDGEIIIRQRSFEGGSLQEPIRYRYNNRSFLPTVDEDVDWWQELHYIKLRVTSTPYSRRVTASVFDLKDEWEYNIDTLTVFDTEDELSPWERRFSFSYFYDYEPEVEDVLYTGLRGWGVPTYFHYLSVEPIACEPFIVTGAIAEYLFEEDDFPGRDTSGNEYHGDPEGGFTTDIKELPAYSDANYTTCSYATFDGTSSGLNMGAVPLDLQDQLTVMAWVRKTDNHDSNWASIVASAASGGSNGRFWLHHNQDNTRYEFAVRTTENRRFILSDLEPSGGWQHVAGVYDGNTIRMYVDGVLQGQTRDLTGDIEPHSNNFIFTIGRDATLRRFRGNIDEVRVFNRAMNAGEINEWRVETRPCGWWPPEPVFPDTDDYEPASNEGWYQGGSSNINRDQDATGKSIRVDRENTTIVSAGETILRADSVAFDTNLAIGNNAHLVLEVKESVIFLGGISFGNQNSAITIRAFDVYPILVYFRNDVLAGLTIAPGSSYEEIVGDEVTVLVVTGEITITD